jgi:hypothetical protein
MVQMVPAAVAAARVSPLAQGLQRRADQYSRRADQYAVVPAAPLPRDWARLLAHGKSPGVRFGHAAVVKHRQAH